MFIAIWTIFAISIVIIIISFIMSPSSNSFSGALVGSSDLELFKVSNERGSKKVLKYLMFSFGLLLFIGSLITQFLIK